MVKHMSNEIEEGSRLMLDFKKIEQIAASVPGVIPAVAQDARTGHVLMVGYVNEVALKTALERKLAVFWSTSRNELWIKGATSGDTLELVEARVNCEQNSILYLVRTKGEGACHTREAGGRSRRSCYYRVIDEGTLRHAPYEPEWQGHSSTQG
jgi:phosphoribosyl-AMP cyclohydrolase